jgi:hypothetical protein
VIEIRPGRDSDKDAILALIKQTFGAEQAELTGRRWQWQWHQDPRLEQPGYRGVVAVWQDQVIANLACIPAGLHIAGEPVEAHWCVDVLTNWGSVRRALREAKHSKADLKADLSRGIAAALLDHPTAGPIQLAKHIADPMKAICLRIGYEDLAHSGNYSRRLSFKQSLQASLGSIPGALVAMGADLPFAGIRRPKLQVESLDGPFDDRFDRLWARVKRDYSAITLRDAATLNWRYRAHPDTSYSALVIPDADEIRGYILFSSYSHGPRLRAGIVDLLADPDDKRAIEDLLAAAMRTARKEGADRIGCFVTGTSIEGAVRRLGFRPRLKKSKQPQPLISRRLPVPDLYATNGDGDGG